MLKILYFAHLREQLGRECDDLVLPDGVANVAELIDFLKNADNENITSFFKSVQLVINNIKIENTGYRLITNSGEDGGQEVPHFHIHILAGEKIGSLG